MALLTKAYDAGGPGIGQTGRLRWGVQHRTESHGFFASPTESEFSEHYDSKPSTRNWDEERVAEWLRSINCSQYVELFLVNNINGACLMELDRSHLRDMGIKKVGDQIRIASQAKKFRTTEYQRFSKRQTNRESLAMLDSASFTPPSSASPKPPSSRSMSSRPDKRMSRQLDLAPGAVLTYGQKTGSRPSSPYVEDTRTRNQARYGGMSPPQRIETHPPGTVSSAGKPPLSSASVVSRYQSQPRSGSTSSEPLTARLAGHRPTQSMDNTITTQAILPMEKPYIRVIYDNGRASVVNIDGWKTPEDVMLKALKKGNMNEREVKNYCFYVLDGPEPNPALCRPINDVEVRRICQDHSRLERSRLILRKINMGVPDEEQLNLAAGIATQQQLLQTQNVVVPNNPVSKRKVEDITGESLPPLSYPLSPATERHIQQQHYLNQRQPSRQETPRSHQNPSIRKMKELFGGRPPSELIASDLSTYFPEYQKDEIDRTVRNSIRRSRRISRAASRLSTFSNASVASSLKDAPPLPSISDAWLNAQNNSMKTLRPLSVLRLGGGFRDSITSSVLEPLDEESPLEPDRKSYVSFSGASEVAVTDPDGNTTLKSYYDDAVSSVANSSTSGDGEDSLNKRLSQLVHEDSEESDEELNGYLENPSWDNIKYMKGALIGKGSFGSVYLALHAVTGELMAVKQVEIPQDDVGDSQAEKKKNMLAALKHEIGLLRELKHPNIVQYLGSNSDDQHLNIFLEYVPGGSVATMLVNYGPLGESLISNFVRQILTGLAYLHSMDIIHRDIKGANILVDNKGAVKISDFGISKRVEAETILNGGAAGGGAKGLQRVSLQGSVFWMAPEVVRQTTYTRKADIWSLGCLIVEMFTGHHPHPNCTQMQAIFRIGSGNGKDASPTIPDHASAELRDFCSRTFEIDHEMRPSADELLRSAFVVGAGAGA